MLQEKISRIDTRTIDFEFAQPYHFILIFPLLQKHQALQFLFTIKSIPTQTVPHLKIIIAINMSSSDKLFAVQQQKRRLKQRILQIDQTQIQKQPSEVELSLLLHKKQMLEKQLKSRQQQQKIEEELRMRKEQALRHQQIEAVRNQKRILELQAAMKRVVFEGIKQKVKGKNSEQILARGLLRTQNNEEKEIGGQDKGIRRQLQDYLLKDAESKQKMKYNLQQLNEQRMQLFAKKEETVMRQILLKQLAARDNFEIDVMSLSRDELQQEMQSLNIDISEYMHPIAKEQIVNNLENIQQDINERIKSQKKQLEAEKIKIINAEQQRKILKEEVSQLPFKDQEIAKRIIYDLIDKICGEYDKRHMLRSKEDYEMKEKGLQQEYEELLMRNLMEQLSNEIVDQMMEQAANQMIKDSAEQVFRLHEFAHLKTQECFKAIFEGDGLGSKLENLNKYKLPLNFTTDGQEDIGKPKNEKYLQQFDNNDTNVYQTEQNTVPLVNDITLLDAQQSYMSKIQTQIKNQKELKTEDYILFYDQQLYLVGPHHIKSYQHNKVISTYSLLQDPILHVSKLNQNWLIQTNNHVILITTWNTQTLQSIIGSRISNPCGNLSYALIHPSITLLGSPCSALMGFQKGQILKFNYNRNRVTSVQTNITHYIPILQSLKTGDEPAFPLEHRNYIQVEPQKLQGNSQIHEFREFFEHHTEKIVFLGFYKLDKFISVDSSLKCALWTYSSQSSFEPTFKFEIKSTFDIYKEDDNPGYKDIYPTSTSAQSPQEMFNKYMLTQTNLKLQLYNNPKKQIAYLRSPNWNQQTNPKSLWKITYDQNKKTVNKILEASYNPIEGHIECKSGRIDNDCVYLLCEREHVIRNDLKTIKIYGWHLTEKRLNKVAIEIDMFKDQQVNHFQILQPLANLDIETCLVVNSGRILLFSLVSGQLLKNINEQFPSSSPIHDYYFRTFAHAPDRNLIYVTTASNIGELSLEDSNGLNERNKMNKIIESAKRKYYR